MVASKVPAILPQDHSLARVRRESIRIRLPGPASLIEFILLQDKIMDQDQGVHNHLTVMVVVVVTVHVRQEETKLAA